MEYAPGPKQNQLEWIREDLSAMLRAMTKDQRMAIRVALTGKTVGLPLEDVMLILGRASCLRRIDRALQLVNDANNDFILTNLPL